MTYTTRRISFHATSLYPAVALALLATFWIAGPAYATGETILTVHIPFSFVVRDTTLPAGDYFIRQLETTPARELEIESRDGSHRVLFLTETADVKEPAKTASLQFNECGGQKRLAQLWRVGSTVREQVVHEHTAMKHCGMAAKPMVRHVSASSPAERGS